MRMAHTTTATAGLEYDRRISKPANTVAPTKANGLAMRDAVKYDEGGDKGDGKDSKPSQASRQKHGFVSGHKILHSLSISIQHRI